MNNSVVRNSYVYGSYGFGGALCASDLVLHSVVLDNNSVRYVGTQFSDQRRGGAFAVSHISLLLLF